MLKDLLNFQNYSKKTLIIIGLCVLALIGFLYLQMAKTGNKELGGDNEPNLIPEAPIENTDENQVMEGTNLNTETQQVSCHTEEGQIETFEEAVSDVFMDVNIGGQEKTMILKLYDDIVPKTTTNFRELARNGKYNNCPFHRIIKDFMIQGGDFANGDGTGGESIYGPKFKDENFNIKHDKPGLLSMANSGPDTNGSQFFITTKETPHLDGKHVVFGEVKDGLDVLKEIEELETDDNDRPKTDCFIIRCGLVAGGKQ